MSNIASLENIVYWANITVVIALALSFLGGGTSIIFSRLLNKAKDEQTRIEKNNVDEQIASLNAETEKAKEAIAIANQKAAEANARAEEARLELAKFKAPRILTPKQRIKFVADMKEFSGTAFDISGSTDETLGFALDIESALVEAGWDRRSWTGDGEAWNLPGRSFRAGNVITWGVHVQIFDASLSKAKDALVSALQHAGFDGVRGTIENVPPQYLNRNVMHIHFGTKL